MNRQRLLSPSFRFRFRSIFVLFFFRSSLDHRFSVVGLSFILKKSVYSLHDPATAAQTVWADRARTSAVTHVVTYSD